MGFRFIPICENSYYNICDVFGIGNEFILCQNEQCPYYEGHELTDLDVIIMQALEDD